VVQLVEKGGQGRSLPIWIGLFEAQAIAVELEGVAEPRPATHDLMKEIVSALGGRLDRVVVGQLEHDTYLARLELERSGGERANVDARPSDAIALALRLRRPIFVEPAVFAASDEATGAPAQAFGITAQDLTPDLAEVLAPGAHGAVVTDVDRTVPRASSIARTSSRVWTARPSARHVISSRNSSAAETVTRCGWRCSATAVPSRSACGSRR
jgi:bifunctional DNase/RNase